MSPDKDKSNYTLLAGKTNSVWFRLQGKTQPATKKRVGEKMSRKAHRELHYSERSAVISSINVCCKELDTVRQFLVFSLGENDWQALAPPQLSAGTKKRLQELCLSDEGRMF